MISESGEHQHPAGSFRLYTQTLSLRAAMDI